MAFRGSFASNTLLSNDFPCNSSSIHFRPGNPTAELHQTIDTQSGTTAHKLDSACIVPFTLPTRVATYKNGTTGRALSLIKLTAGGIGYCGSAHGTHDEDDSKKGFGEEHVDGLGLAELDGMLVKEVSGLLDASSIFGGNCSFYRAMLQ